MGIRAAGHIDNVVFLAGPSMISGINIFAYNAQTEQFIDSINLPQYNDIRAMLEVNGALYMGVSSTTGGGKIVRWTGSGPALLLVHQEQDEKLLPSLFQFEEVGDIDGNAANMTYHTDGKIYVSTWWPMAGVATAGLDVGAPLAGIWESPVVPAGGLTASHAGSWNKVWQVDQYEPDRAVAQSYVLGPIVSFEGHLIWGTMHIPGISFLSFIQQNGMPENLTDALLAFLGTWRATSVFKTQHFDRLGVGVELLYGMPYLPAYSSQDGWSFQKNKIYEARRAHGLPRHGLSGFNNFFNSYTWSMQVHEGNLYMGTFDSSSIIYDVLLNQGVNAKGGEIGQIFLPGYGTVPEDALKLPDPNRYFIGADLLRFPHHYFPAQYENITGLGNPLNYGVRTMVSREEGLFAGTANPFNMARIDDPDNGYFRGGWELVRLFTPEEFELDCAVNVDFPMQHTGNRIRFQSNATYAGTGYDDIVWEWSFGDGTGDSGSPYTSHVYETPGVYNWVHYTFGIRYADNINDPPEKVELCAETGVIVVLPEPYFDYILVDELGRGILKIASNTGFIMDGFAKDGHQIPAYYEYYNAANGQTYNGFGAMVDNCRPGQNHNICFFNDPDQPWYIEYELDLEDCLSKAKFIYYEKNMALTLADFTGCPRNPTPPVQVLTVVK